MREGFSGGLGSRKGENPWRRWSHCYQPSLIVVFFSKAANLTSIVDEKEQSLQESMATILQKEQEILQLKKGEGSALFLPSTSTLRWLRHEAAWSHWAHPLPGLGHDAALLQAHQLRSELQALRNLRAEEPEAPTVREDLLRLPGQEQGLALSVSELQVSPMPARQAMVYGSKSQGRAAVCQ